ncbi:MAG: formate C-acetyltransferase/glycerol dehydratase family glycyl radical enzyme, partial [Candidatus Bathyarchaeota archaeon]|nr:formate C-acetyltransferase/glycerol dehydratase family glycyl radical enzyme [Candidatus Bathyarchaeota archaeon]
MTNNRIEKLWKQSVDTVPFIDPERAVLITDFYRSEFAKGLSGPVLRALAYKRVLEHKTLYIEEGELLVGEKGRSPRAVPTYPELCCHSLQDLDILESRSVTPYRVSRKTRKIYEEYVIPF